MSGAIPQTAAFLQLLQTGRVEEARELLRRDGSKAVETVSILEEVFPCMLTTVAESYDTHGVTGHEKPFFDLARELWYLMPQAERDIVDMLVTFVYAGCKFNQVEFVKWVLPIALRHPLVDMYALTVDRMAEFNQLRHSALYYVCKNGSTELYDVLTKAIGGTPPVVLETRVFDHLVASALRVGARPPVPVYRSHGGDVAPPPAAAEEGGVSARSGRGGSEHTEASSAAIVTGDDSSVKRPEEPDPPSLYAALREGHMDFTRHVLGALSPSDQSKVLRTLVVHGIIPMDDAATAEQLFSLCAQPPLELNRRPGSGSDAAPTTPTPPAPGSGDGAGAGSSGSSPAVSTPAEQASANPSPAVSRRASAVSLVDSETLVCALAAARHAAPLAVAVASSPAAAAAPDAVALTCHTKPLHQRHEYLALHLCMFVHETCADAAYVRPRPAVRYAAWLLSTLPLVATQPVNGMRWAGAARYGAGGMASGPPLLLAFPYAHADRDILTRPRWKDPYGNPFVFALESERSRAGSGSLSGSFLAGTGAVPPSPGRGGAGSVTAAGGLVGGLPALPSGPSSELSAWVAWTPLHAACAASCVPVAKALVERDPSLATAPALLLLPGAQLGGLPPGSGGSTGGGAALAAGGSPVLSVPTQQCHPIRVAVEAAFWTRSLALTSWLLHFLAPVQLDAQLYQPCKALAVAKAEFIKDVCKDTTLSLRAFRSGGLMGPSAAASAAAAASSAVQGGAAAAGGGGSAAANASSKQSHSKKKQHTGGGGSSARRRQSSAAESSNGAKHLEADALNAGRGGRDNGGSSARERSPDSPAAGAATSAAEEYGGETEAADHDNDPHEEGMGSDYPEEGDDTDSFVEAAADYADEGEGYRGGRAGSGASQAGQRPRGGTDSTMEPGRALEDDTEEGEWEETETSRRRRGTSGATAGGLRAGGAPRPSGKQPAASAKQGSGYGPRGGGLPPSRRHADTTSDGVSAPDSDFEEAARHGAQYHSHAQQARAPARRGAAELASRAERPESASSTGGAQAGPARRHSGRAPGGAVSGQPPRPAGHHQQPQQSGKRVVVKEAAVASSAGGGRGHMYRGRAKSEGAEVLLARGTGLSLLLQAEAAGAGAGRGDDLHAPAPAAVSAPVLQRPPQQHQHMPHRLNAIAEAMSREASLAHIGGEEGGGRPGTPTALPGALPRSKSTRGSFARVGSTGFDAAAGGGGGDGSSDGDGVVIVARGAPPVPYETVNISPLHSSDVLGLRRAAAMAAASSNVPRSHSRSGSGGLPRIPLPVAAELEGTADGGGYEYPDPLLGIPLDSATPVASRAGAAAMVHPAVSRVRGEGGRGSRSPAGRGSSGVSRREPEHAAFADWELGFGSGSGLHGSSGHTNSSSQAHQQPPPLLPASLGPPPGLHRQSGAPAYPQQQQQQVMAAFALLSHMFPGGVPPHLAHLASAGATTPHSLGLPSAGAAAAGASDPASLTPAAIAQSMQSLAASASSAAAGVSAGSGPAATGPAGGALAAAGSGSQPRFGSSAPATPFGAGMPPASPLVAEALAAAGAPVAALPARDATSGLPPAVVLPLSAALSLAPQKPRFGVHGSTVLPALCYGNQLRVKRLDIGNTFPALPVGYCRALQALGSRAWWPLPSAAGAAVVENFSGVARVLTAEGVCGGPAADLPTRGLLVSEWFDATLAELWPKATGAGLAPATSPLRGAGSPTKLPGFGPSASFAGWPLGARLALCRQIAAGLAYLHARGFPHGGIRPSNVGLCLSGASIPDGLSINAALCDPGLAVAALGAPGVSWPLRLRTLQAWLQGSSGYLPAEVLAAAHALLEAEEPDDSSLQAGEAQGGDAGAELATWTPAATAQPAWQLAPGSDPAASPFAALLQAVAVPATDVFALGCLFASLLDCTPQPGRHPFGSRPFRDAHIMAHKEPELQVPPSLTASEAAVVASLLDVVRSMMAHDPAARPSAAAVAAYLGLLRA